jgi:sugar phosphate isomerase/epimerase
MNRISFASGIVPECGPLETIQAAATGGFDATGLWIEPEKWSAPLTRDARRALADTGLELLDVEVIWIKPGDNLDTHKAVIDIGAALGAKNVLCVSSDPDAGRTAGHLAASSAYC